MGINITQLSGVIDKYLKRLGKSVVAVKGKNEVQLFAVIEQTWRKNKSRFEGTFTALGEAISDYYEYYGSASFDITLMTKNDYIICEGRRYYFVKTERVTVGGQVQMYTGMMKRIREEDSDAFR